MEQVKTWLKTYWYVALLAGLAGGFFLWQQDFGQQAIPPASSSMAPVVISSSTAPAAASTAGPQAGFVHIKGAVVRPGLYPVDGTTRWDAVVKKAGGLTAKADVSAINLALVASDQESLFIPEIGETPPPAAATPAATPGAGSASSQEALVNINTADATLLQTLSGIGPKKAADIIAYRETSGGFKTIEDLKEVSGIGEKTFEKLAPLVTVGP